MSDKENSSSLIVHNPPTRTGRRLFWAARSAPGYHRLAGGMHIEKSPDLTLFARDVVLQMPELVG